MTLIDLSQPISSGMEVHPGDPEVRVSTEHTYGSHGWLLRRLNFGSHTGTHIDAPSHMDPDGSTLSQLPIHRFMGPAVVTRTGEEHPAWVGLLFLDEVGLPELEAILEAEPLFVGGAIDERLERELLRRDVVTYTGLLNLDKLPTERSFTFIGFPLPIADGDGSPVRAVAMLDD